MTSWQEEQSILLLVFSEGFPSLVTVRALTHLSIPHHCCSREEVQTGKQPLGDSSWSRGQRFL